MSCAAASCAATAAYTSRPRRRYVPGGAKLGPFTGEAEGEDAAAVAKATRAVTEKLKLVCAR